MKWVWTMLLAAVLGAKADGLTITWTNNMLRVRGPEIPGEYVEVWYLEAFCRSASTHADWVKHTVIPHKTELISATAQKIRLRSTVEPNVIFEHEITADANSVDFKVRARNRGKEFADVQWFQPCVRVDRFTGLSQSNYITRSFIFTADGPRTLDKLPRAEEAVYRGGQVYVPAGIPMEDVNPRPISSVRPVNGLIGCLSKDGSKLLATAWDHTQELFQGVITCLHNDPRVGGLAPGARLQLHGKLYILPNDTEALLKRYHRDFPAATKERF